MIFFKIINFINFASPINYMVKINKFCQSCGMPMKKDPENGGTNKNGSKNLTYCSYCYKGGKFTQPNITVKEMQDFCIKKMHEMKIPRFMGWILTRNLPKLKRWNK